MRKHIVPTRPTFQPFRTLRPSYYQRTRQIRISQDYQATLKEPNRIRAERKAEVQHLAKLMKHMDEMIMTSRLLNTEFRKHAVNLRELANELDTRIGGEADVKVSLSALIIGGVFGLGINWFLSTTLTSDDYGAFEKAHAKQADEQTSAESITSAEPFF
ncbi:hypothetical protein D6D13_07879 [Aureobasidium pullulans]|uniref:Uncharacterized protein n=1 Tax=Aureobasidium pullulans TaxID=5580 RepID=A0A4S9C8T6_AURPU|nr:hypothetical protein D6D13_07879 [Aureobasidium pullulans]